LFTDFSAKEPSLGYHYQFLYSLFKLIKTNDPASKVRIECLDDIEVINNSSHELIQTKLHVKSSIDLTDSSPDFWKSLRIWIENIKQGNIDIDNTSFSLVTTSRVSRDSVLYNFATSNLHQVNLFTELELIEQLDKIANTSKNKILKNAFDVYLSTPIEIKEKLVKKIDILDSSLNTEDLIEAINHELRLSIVTDKLSLLSERVIGVWMVYGIKHLLGEIEEITFKDLQNVVLDLANSFKEDNLPNDFIDIISVTNEEASSLSSKTFIKQLELISLRTTSRRVKNAISDFRRAYEQRSRWIREQLISINEQEIYEKELIDTWNNLFGILEDQCENINDENNLKLLCKEFYTNFFVQNVPKVYIKRNFTNEYMIRGSYQILADKKLVGWHPKFNELI